MLHRHLLPLTALALFLPACGLLGGLGGVDNDPPPPEIHGCFYDSECDEGLYCSEDHQCHTPPTCSSKLGCDDGTSAEACVFDTECGDGTDSWCNLGVCEQLPVLLDPCSSWSGPTSGGNDPDSVFRIDICRDEAGNITGTSSTSSPRSGRSERIIEGRILDEQTLHVELWETALTVDEPNEGWRFCTAERYDLRLRVDKLVGTFVSSACNDDGWVLLTLEE